MKYGKLEIFLIKRIAAIYLVLSLLTAIFLETRLLVVAGLTFGGIAGILRLNFIASLLMNLFTGNTAPHAPQASADMNRKTMRSTIIYVLSLFGVLALLVASMLYDPWLFAGVTAGILILPLCIMVNGITEGFGLTHNKFGA